jgi:hypothetical protein
MELPRNLLGRLGGCNRAPSLHLPPRCSGIGCGTAFPVHPLVVRKFLQRLLDKATICTFEIGKIDWLGEARIEQLFINCLKGRRNHRPYSLSPAQPCLDISRFFRTSASVAPALANRVSIPWKRVSIDGPTSFGGDAS